MQKEIKNLIEKVKECAKRGISVQKEFCAGQTGEKIYDKIS